MNFGLAVKFAAVAAALGASVAASATPTNFSFAGTFVQDDNVALINFTVNSTSNVTFRSFGYAGGTQASGNVVGAGGFDPFLVLFGATGGLLDSNDDPVACGTVPGHLGNIFDACFVSTLAAGGYTVAVLQSGNSAIGPNLSNGFLKSGQPNFTDLLCTNDRFCDSKLNNRTGNWAFDILGVEQASLNNVPEPSALALVGLALAGLGLRARARRA